MVYTGAHNSRTPAGCSVGALGGSYGIYASECINKNEFFSQKVKVSTLFLNY